MVYFQKHFSFRGTSSPRPPTAGLCPWTPLGTTSPRPLHYAPGKLFSSWSLA